MLLEMLPAVGVIVFVVLAVLVFGAQQAGGTVIVSGAGLDISKQRKTGAGTLSFTDVAQYASDAGFEGDDLTNIVAVCFAESSGKPDALNSNGTVAPPEGSRTDVYSVGLWQINLKAHRNYQNVNLFDPATNASAAWDIFNGQGFDAWGGYTSGNYSHYLAQAKVASDMVSA